MAERATAGTWAACIAGALLMLALSTFFVRIVHSEERVYAELEMKELPEPTNLTLALGPYLWILALSGSAWGFRMLRTRERSIALSWFLWSLLVLVIVQGLMTYALFLPIIIIMTRLSK